MKNLTIVVLLGSALLCGCLEKKPKQPEGPQQKVVIEVVKPKEETVQTVTWFKEHKEERLAMLKRCSENPGELGDSPNFVNASQADNELDAAKRGGLEVKPIKGLYEKIKRENELRNKQNSK